jgi:hypothetical protein
MTVAVAVSSLHTVLKVEIATVLTAVAGIRNVDWKPGDVETMEIDAIDDDYVNLDATGRVAAGEVTAQMFTDLSSAAYAKFVTLFVTPAKNDFQIEWPQDITPGTAGLQPALQPFKGILKSLPIKAERGAPLLTDISIAVAERPTLVTF